jgi:hypothetical protein
MLNDCPGLRIYEDLAALSSALADPPTVPVNDQLSSLHPRNFEQRLVSLVEELGR